MANQAAIGLLRVLSERESLEPDKTLSSGRYTHDYRSKEALFGELAPLFVRHGIMPVLRVVEHELTPKGKDGKDVCARVRIEIDIIHGESGDVVTSAWCGEAADAYDKATTKATTSAVRTWLDNLFMIGGDEPFANDYADQRGSSSTTKSRPAANPPTEDEVAARIETVLTAVGVSTKQAGEYLDYIDTQEGGKANVGRLEVWADRLEKAAKADPEKLLGSVISRLNKEAA